MLVIRLPDEFHPKGPVSSVSRQCVAGFQNKLRSRILGETRGVGRMLGSYGKGSLDWKGWSSGNSRRIATMEGIPQMCSAS